MLVALTTTADAAPADAADAAVAPANAADAAGAVVAVVAVGHRLQKAIPGIVVCSVSTLNRPLSTQLHQHTKYPSAVLIPRPRDTATY